MCLLETFFENDGPRRNLKDGTLVRAHNRAAQKIKFSIKDFSSKCAQIRRKLQISSHLPEKSFFCAVSLP